MSNVVMVIQIVLSLVLLLSVMCQDTKNGVKTDFGSEGSQAYFKPKGKDAFLSKVTAISGTLFIVNAIVMLMIQ